MFQRDSEHIAQAGRASIPDNWFPRGSRQWCSIRIQTGHKPFMDLSQAGGDVSLGPLIICCYSQTLVIIDKHPVSLMYSANRVLLQTREENRRCKEVQREKLGTRAYPGMTACCTHSYACALSITTELSTCLSTMITGIQIVLGPYTSKALKYQTYS